MFGKEFFVNRYRLLGWEFKDVTPKQAIRINTINVNCGDVTKWLKGLGVELEEIPFLRGGYWIVRSEFSVGATVEYLGLLFDPRGCRTDPGHTVYRIEG